MRKLVLALLFVVCAVAQHTMYVAIKSSPDVVGTGATIQVFPQGGGAWGFTITADPSNVNPVRCGDL